MIPLSSRINQFLTPQRMRYPWLVGGAMWLGWLISLLFGKGNTDLAGHLIGADFVAFYTAGKIVLAGQSADLYSLELARQIQQPLYGFASDNFNPYLNPPFYAWLCAPFASLPYPYSPIVWMAANLVLLWLSLKWLGAEKPARAMGYALTWLPAFSAISFGQNAFISLALFSLAYLLQRRKHPLAAGLVSGLLFYKPQLMLGIGLLWLLEWRRAWRSLLGMALTCAALAGLSLAFMPAATQAYLGYAQKIAANLVAFEAFPMWNAHGVYTFWLALFPNQIRLVQALYVLCAAGGVFLFFKLWRKRRGEEALLFAAALCLTVWITPYLMVYDWVLLLVPAVILWQKLPEQRSEWMALFIVLWITMFFSSALTFAQLQAFGAAIQLSVPVLGWCLFSAYRWLIRCA